MSSTEHKAGAFDVRVVIAGLIGFYGVVLVLMGLFADPETEKTGGVNANLWTGIGLVVVALAFFLWARLRPVVVDEAELARARAEDGDRPAH
ncbi:hypothetical protein [Geodermatophilus sp. SYSU D00815]